MKRNEPELSSQLDEAKSSARLACDSFILRPERGQPLQRIPAQIPVAAGVSPLHLIPEEVRANSPSLLRLELTLQAGRPSVGWTKQGTDGLEIWVDRGTSTFAFLAIDTIPHCPRPAPARFGNTRPSTGSTMNKLANGATWPASA